MRPIPMTTSPRPTGWRLVAAALLPLAVLAACADGGPTGLASPAASATTAIHATSKAEADLVLYVSNQSFADDPVHLTVTIDDHTVVEEDFEVEGQHNWVEFPLAVPAGGHHVTATSDTGATLEADFDTRQGQVRYAVIDYWNYQDDEGRHFGWRIGDEPIAFD